MTTNLVTLPRTTTHPTIKDGILALIKCYEQGISAVLLAEDGKKILATTK